MTTSSDVVECVGDDEVGDGEEPVDEWPPVLGFAGESSDMSAARMVAEIMVDPSGV